jgi:hypothetical protein
LITHQTGNMTMTMMNSRPVDAGGRDGKAEGGGMIREYLAAALGVAALFGMLYLMLLVTPA